jgi:hypothetical protein
VGAGLLIVPLSPQASPTRLPFLDTGEQALQWQAEAGQQFAAIERVRLGQSVVFVRCGMNVHNSMIGVHQPDDLRSYLFSVSASESEESS